MSENEKMCKNWKQTKAFRELRESLRTELTSRGLTGKIYQDKLEEYLDFWCRRQELKADVAARGLTVMDDRGRISENRSISLEIQVSRQMLTIFTALGFKPDEKGLNAGGDDDDL